MAPSKFIQSALDNKLEKKSSFPYTITRINLEINEELLKDFTGERSYFVQVGPKKYFFPSNYEHEAEKFYNFEVRQNDIWIVTFPRSGTTWTQEMVWLIANDLDYETARLISLNERCPFLEFSTFVHPDVKQEFLKENNFCPVKLKMVEEVTRKEWQNLPMVKTRRIIKTHLPFSLLPPNLLTSGCKVIYVARNPKDVIISYYHLNKLFKTQGYDGDLVKYWSYFKRNLQAWTPYWEHVQEGWEKRFEENFLFMFYENMNKNCKEAIGTVATFLGKQLTTDQVIILSEHLKIENFRKNPSVNNELLRELGIIRDTKNGFIRNGKTGGWKEEINNELSEEIDKWIEDHLKKTDLRFPKNAYKI